MVHAGAAARGPAARTQAYTDALLAEIGLRAAGAAARFGPAGTPARRPLETVYLGGGTPTLLPPDAIAAILQAVRAGFGIADGAEVTIESNPGPDERGD
ncbi:MAG: hypothetical protein WCK58_04990, partial [Chloroflexota bacterium]